MLIRRRQPNMIDRVFEDWNRTLSDATHRNTLALDVTEVDGLYTITTDIPGFTADDIRIDLVDDVLTITAESNSDHTETDDMGNMLLQERRSGKFTRSVRFPVHVDRDAIEADVENGVLTITVPKAPEAEPRRIAVNTR